VKGGLEKKMNKKLLAFGVLGFFALALVSAGVIQYYGQVQQDVNVNQAITFTGDNQAPATVAGGESVTSNDLLVESQTSVNVPLGIETTSDPDEVGIEHEVNYILDNSLGTCLPYPSETCEKRIFISGTDAGVLTLSDLDSMSWDVEVIGGYVTHVDVLIDTDSDGVKDDALVFEYAKVDPLDCDDTADYPTGSVNTFGDKGIVDGSAYAWLSSGVPGYCGLTEFDDNHRSLADWKLEGYDVIGFELEVDNWISPSNSEVRNILINGASVEPTLLPSGSLTFNVDTTFGLLNVGTYTITTEVTPRV
jgi:hypothetical protein